jgi:hypothetical protein
VRGVRARGVFHQWNRTDSTGLSKLSKSERILGQCGARLWELSVIPVTAGRICFVSGSAGKCRIFGTREHRWECVRLSHSFAKSANAWGSRRDHRGWVARANCGSTGVYKVVTYPVSQCSLGLNIGAHHSVDSEPGILVCRSMESWWRRRFNTKRRRLRTADRRSSDCSSYAEYSQEAASTACRLGRSSETA